MKNGTIQIGFADPYKVYNESEYTGEVDDIIYLWTWDNIDETTHRLIGYDDDKYSQMFIVYGGRRNRRFGNAIRLCKNISCSSIGTVSPVFLAK